MKSKNLHSTHPFSFFGMVTVISGCLFCFSATTTLAQSGASVAPPPPISTEDYDQAPDWKQPVDYAAVLVAERNNAATTLATPNLKEAEIALYTGYDRMLAYMQQDMIANTPIEEIAEKNHKKVLGEAGTDPALLHMATAELNALYVALLGMLHQ